MKPGMEAGTSFVNLNNFEVTDILKDFIPCDDEIAQTIAILNEKGYKTLYCCAGHNKNGYLRPTIKEAIETLENFKKEYGNNKTIHIIDIDDKYFYHKDDEIYTGTYICFDKNYHFSSLPLGFEITEEDEFGRINISKVCYFFIDEKKGIRRKDSEIDRELAQNHRNLYEWAKGLDYIKK